MARSQDPQNRYLRYNSEVAQFHLRPTWLSHSPEVRQRLLLYLYTIQNDPTVLGSPAQNRDRILATGKWSGRTIQRSHQETCPHSTSRAKGLERITTKPTSPLSNHTPPNHWTDPSKTTHEEGTSNQDPSNFHGGPTNRFGRGSAKKRR